MKTKQPKPPARKDDSGVLRQYFEAAPNRMFSEVQRLCVRFARYQEPVPCALCGKQRKRHWTCVVRFKAVELGPHTFQVVLPKAWLPAGSPVCSDHLLHPDEKEFLRKARQQLRERRKAASL